MTASSCAAETNPAVCCIFTTFMLSRFELMVYRFVPGAEDSVLFSRIDMLDRHLMGQIPIVCE